MQSVVIKHFTVEFTSLWIRRSFSIAFGRFGALKRKNCVKKIVFDSSSLKTKKKHNVGALFHTSMNVDELTNWRQFLCVCPVIDHKFCHHIVKVALDPQGDCKLSNFPLSLVDASREFQIHVCLRILSIKINQWARVNFCSYQKMPQWSWRNIRKK